MPERRGEERATVAWYRKVPGRSAGLSRVRRQGSASQPAKPEGREGERPREAKPRRARVPSGAEKSAGGTPTDRGTKPLKRGRKGSNATCAKSAANATDPRGTGPRVRAEESIPADGQSRGGVEQKAFCLLNAARSLIARGDVTSRERDDLC